VIETTEIVTGLSPFLTYDFKVRARNVINFSVDSTELTNIIAAQPPD